MEVEMYGDHQGAAPRELIAHDLGPIGGWERREHPKPRERQGLGAVGSIDRSPACWTLVTTTLEAHASGC